MIKQQVYLIINLLMLLDSFCILIAGYFSYHIFNTLLIYLPAVDVNVVFGSIILMILLNNYVMGKIGLYNDKSPSSYSSLILMIVQAAAINFIILSAGLYLFPKIQFPRQFLILFLILYTVTICVQRSVVLGYVFKNKKNKYSKRNILVVGDNERVKIVSDILEKQISFGHEIIGRVTLNNYNDHQLDDEDIKGKGRSGIKIIGKIEDLSKLLRTIPIDEVIFATHGDRKFNIDRYLRLCYKMGIQAKVLPAMWQPERPFMYVEEWQNVPFLTIQSGNFNATGLLYKRVLDLVGGFIGSVVLLLMFPIIGLAIKLDSPGPVFFTQKRIGKNGRRFILYKFRSMIENAERMKDELKLRNEMNGQIFKIGNDPRITRVGRLLRKTSLDEFPQFLNVLKGEMSLVGTRPPTPDEVDEYQLWHLKRLSIKPGITGLWQTCGRNQIRDFDKIVELDCRYIDQWRFFEDIKIIFKTFVVVLQRKGAL